MYNATYQVIALILPLITEPYIARVLGASNIGNYSYSYVTAYYFGLFILLGLNNYGNRTIAKVRDNKQCLSKTFFSIYVFQLLLGLILVFLYIVYVLLFSQLKTLAMIQIIYLISIVLDIEWFFCGIEQFKLTFFRNTIIKLTSVLFIFIFIKEEKDVYIYAIIMVLAPLMRQLLFWRHLKNYVQFTDINIKDVVAHIKPNLILFIPVIATSMYSSINVIMLGNFTTMQEVAYYQNSYKLMSIPVIAISSICTALLPRISNLESKGDITTSLNYIKKSFLISAILSSSIAFGISSVSKEFVPLFYGNGFEKCIEVIPILMLSSIFSSWSIVLRIQYLIPFKKDNIYIVSVFVGAFVNLIVSVCMINYFQSVGAAIGTLCAEVVVFTSQNLAIRKKLDVVKYLIKSIPFVLNGIIMFICVMLIPPLSNAIYTIIFKITVGCFIYFLLFIIYYKVSYIRKKHVC